MVTAKTLVRGLMIIGMSVALVGCGGDSADLVLDDADNGKTVLVDSGDRFEVRLEANATTGFEWVVDSESASEVVTIVSSTYEEPPTDLVGAPGTQIFVFEATTAGAGILRLEYIRPFDEPPVPERIVELIVSVDDVPWTRSADEPPTTSTATAPEPPDTIGVGELFDGEGARDGTFTGFVLWDDAGARLCEMVMESFPPQCGGMWVVIANPAGLDADLQEAQGVRWADGFVELVGRFDGQRLVLDSRAETVVPTAADQELISAFLAHAAAPSETTAANLPFSAETAIGLGDQTLATLTPAELVDPGRWSLDVAEYDGYAGPFSALDLATGPVVVTVGAHARCVGPPVPPPAGFEELRRVSIQPEIATSCLEWWTVDFFVDDDEVVRAVTLDLFGP